MDEDLETLIVALNKVAKSESRIRDLVAQRQGRADGRRFQGNARDAAAIRAACCRETESP